MKRILLLIVLVWMFGFDLVCGNKVEMRASWIATVANIDWPKRDDFDSESQMEDMEDMLDSLASLNINTIYFQIRPTSDAFYYSDFEPWSIYLTGEQNKEPEPYYDPLAFVISKAKERFMDVHVWLNPYRVLNSGDTTLLHDGHLFNRRRDMFLEYGGKYYFNPGLEETRVYLCDVVRDIVSRYDVDGIHFDDYFYPYKVEGEIFPDFETFMNDSKGFENIEDWRRNNVNLVINELSTVIKHTKPWVEFGISPFGVWRNKEDDVRGSATKAGQTNYDDLYADILLWMMEGWIDYVVPQLYWEIGKEVADYEVLLNWWDENSYGKNVYIGMAPYKLNGKSGKAWTTPNELCRQLEMNKGKENIDGVAYFSTKSFLQNRQGFCDSLSANYYKYPALVPSVFEDKSASMQPGNIRVEMMGDRPYLFWDEVMETGGYRVGYYVVYAFPSLSMMDIGDPKYIYARSVDNVIDISALGEGDTSSMVFVVTSVNRYHKESVGEGYYLYYF